MLTPTGIIASSFENLAEIEEKRDPEGVYHDPAEQAAIEHSLEVRNGCYLELFKVLDFYSEGERFTAERREAVLAAKAVIELHPRHTWGWNEMGQANSRIEQVLISKELEVLEPISSVQSVQELEQRVDKAVEASNSGAQVDWVELMTSEYANLDIVEKVNHFPRSEERQIVKGLLEQKRFKFIAELVVYRRMIDADLIRSSVSNVPGIAPEEHRQELFDVIHEVVENPTPDIFNSMIRPVVPWAPLVEFLLEFTVETLTSMHGSYLEIWPLVEEMLGDSQATWDVFETLVNDGEIPIGLAAQSASAI